MTNSGIIICSRANSRRIPYKPLQDIEGETLIKHLVKRLEKANLPIKIAVPHNQQEHYFKALNGCKEYQVFTGSPDSPLERMYQCAKNASLDIIIRVNHDKIFVNPMHVQSGINLMQMHRANYVYSDEFTEGSGMEIISFSALERAAKKFKGQNVEHISYAIKAVTDSEWIYRRPVEAIYRSEHRLLIDYPEDLELVRQIIKDVGPNCTLWQAINYLDNINSGLRNLNKLPDVTIYTCAYNAEKWIGPCMGSIREQNVSFIDDYTMNEVKQFSFEYILVDDGSTDSTYERMKNFAKKLPFVKVLRNKLNLGLASSSNIALKEAKGKYITRLDADDYYLNGDKLRLLYESIKGKEIDVVYPNYSIKGVVHRGIENNHIGGAIFNRNAINHIKFTDGLRGYEGLDFFNRAKDQLKISYLEKEIFEYRQHEKQMTRNNLDDREKIKQGINQALADHRSV